MDSFKVLLKFQIKYKMGFKKSGLSFAIPAILMLLICIVILIPYVFLMGMVFDTYKANGNIDGYVSFLAFSANIIVLILSIFSVYNIMFTDKDREILTPLPIDSKHIFLVNYIIMYLSALGSALVFLLPGFIVLFIKTGFSIVILLKMVAGVIFFPVLPLSVSFLAITVILKIASGLRFKELFATLGGIILLIGALFFNFSADVAVETFTNTSNITLFNKILFNTFLYTEFLQTDGSVSLIFLLLGYSSAALIAIAIYFYGGRVYNSITEQMHSVGNLKRHAELKYSSRTQKNAICIKELKTVIKSPIYALNCLFNIVIAPLVAVMLSQKIPAFTKIAIGEFEMFLLSITVGLGIMSLNMMPSTSISREGKSLWLVQIIPVDIKLQLQGRTKAAVICYWLSGVLFIILFDVLLKIDFLYIIYGLMVILAGSIPFAYTGLWIDLQRPKLYWDKESEAVKQNFNGMLGMLAGIVLTLVYSVPTVLCLLGYMSKGATLLAMPIIILLCIFLTRRMLFKQARRR